MTTQNRIKTVLTLAAVAMAILAFMATSARAATMSSIATAPVVDGEDIANYGTVTGTDKWWNDAATSGRPKGQTFTTGSTEVLLKALTYQVTSTQKAEPTKTYVIRVGTINRVNPGDSTTWIFTQIYTEAATQDFFWAGGEYMTWTFDTPVLLSANTEYGIDVGMTNSTSGWTTGIPYINRTGDEYAGGTRYMSGTAGFGIGDATMNNVGGDMLFHLDLVHPMSPSPQDGATVPAGDVELSWTNLPANVGSDVWVDVWFGTDPVTDFTKVVAASLNTTSKTVSAPVADTYYWQVNSYLNGSPTGDPLEGSVFIFYVIDTDGDGLPDDYELAHTSPPSPTALNPGDDLEPDGLTNLEEYQIGTNPTNPDTDGDTLQDGPELAGVGSRPATDPTDPDTDGDGLNDGVETNTGAYTSATDTGTNPTLVDSDGDALQDGVETNTGIFVDENNTGTDPTKADSDGDGAGDWYEVAASYTDPTEASDNPGILYPLPDPDSTPPDTTKPVKVYILSGQSNMVGMGNISGTQPGTLETITKRENKFPNLLDDAGNWTVRNDVMYRGVITAIGDGPLTPGIQAGGSTIGSDIGFGHIMGYYHDEPVIVLKTSQGNRSIGWDCLPPGSERYIYGDYTYAGYGDSPDKWLTEGGGPEPFHWYAGKQYDDYFLAESDMGPTGWADATYYFRDGIQVRHNGVVYISKSEHTSSAASEPGIGAQSSTYWNVYSVFNVTDVLDNFASEYPEYASQGFEIAGYGWWQGHRDQYDASYADRYEFNLENLINETREYYENRYPGNTRPNAPFVVATIGFGGEPYAPDSAYGKIHAAQMAVSDPVKHPEFAGNVFSFDTRGYWREVEESPANQDYHYNRNAETFMLVGDALGRGMIELDASYSVDAGDDMITWSGEPVKLDATVQEGVTVSSYAWSADDPCAVFDPNVNPADPNTSSVEDPNVTITKPALTLTEVTIGNAGFEDPVLGDGDWESAPPAWTDGYYDVSAPGEWVDVDDDPNSGVYNPTAAHGYGGVVLEGENVAFTTSGADHDYGMNQVLSANLLQANTQYDLSALVGNPFVFNGNTTTADYRIELLAGGVLLKSETGSSPADDTTWETAGLTYNSGDSPAQLGEALEIRLLAVDLAGAKGVDFDDVRLTAEGPTPDPYAVRLTLTVNDGENPPVTNAMTIDVYDDACEAARIGKGLAADNLGDFDGNCITDANDLAEFAAKWLTQGGLTEPVLK